MHREPFAAARWSQWTGRPSGEAESSIIKEAKKTTDSAFHAPFLWPKRGLSYDFSKRGFVGSQAGGKLSFSMFLKVDRCWVW